MPAEALELQVLPAPGTDFWTHYSPVVALSPDGRTLATADAGKDYSATELVTPQRMLGGRLRTPSMR